MKQQSIALGICAASLVLVACGGAVEVEPSTVSFETEDASYGLGMHAQRGGKLVVTEVITDTSSSYLTPQDPNTSWIVDRALAHSQQRPLLLDEVDVRGLYVRDCISGQWINAANSPFAPQGELLQSVVDGHYQLGHFYNNVERNGFLSERFECLTEPASFTTVTTEQGEVSVQHVGDVSFAFVVEHRR